MPQMKTKEVVLMGWVAKNRKLGGVNFVTLRDRTGIVQLAFNDSTDKDVFMKDPEHLKGEYVTAVKGKVLRRTPENVNKNMPTGEIEVFVTELRVLRLITKHLLTISRKTLTLMTHSD